MKGERVNVPLFIFGLLILLAGVIAMDVSGRIRTRIANEGRKEPIANLAATVVGAVAFVFGFMIAVDQIFKWLGLIFGE